MAELICIACAALSLVLYAGFSLRLDMFEKRLDAAEKKAARLAAEAERLKDREDAWKRRRG